MALASTRPIIAFAEAALRRVAGIGGGTPAAWWLSILTIGPMLGSFITEPARDDDLRAAAGPAVLRLQPAPAEVRHAGLLFVNVSIGGTLTHFAAPPVLMVARPWGWDTAFMLGHFGWRAVLAIVVVDADLPLMFRRDCARWPPRRRVPDIDQPDERSAAVRPAAGAARGSRRCTCCFMAWTVFTAHYPALFIGGFLFFLGLRRATALYQSRIELKAPLLVGFFLAGLVIHGGLQGWWIAPVLGLPLRGAAVSGRHAAHGVQRQRAHHLSRDARAEPGRAAEDRRRRRRGHRRRPDGHRQCAQPGGSGAARPRLSSWPPCAVRPAGRKTREFSVNTLHHVRGPEQLQRGNRRTRHRTKRPGSTSIARHSGLTDVGRGRTHCPPGDGVHA